MNRETIERIFGENPQYFLLFLFYSFPQELVVNSEFFDLPRNPQIAITDPESSQRILSKQFLKDMIDMTAYMVWMHQGRRGWMETYSGYSPAYIFAHQLTFWRNLFYTVYRGVDPIELTLRNVSFEWNTMGKATEYWELIVAFSDVHFPYMREVIAIEEELPCFEDFDLERDKTKHSRSYIDFLRKWTHAQTKHPMVLTDRVPEKKSRWTENIDYRIDLERFLNTLEPKERTIFMLKWEGNTQKEIAEIMGYRTHSAVVKRLKKIREKYNEWFED